MSTATAIACEECGAQASPVHRATDDQTGNVLDRPVFKGWFCAHCSHLTKPIGRERGLGMPDEFDPDHHTNDGSYK